MKRYALLDTDFISKTHSVQDDGGNHLIDRVMELPEYEFFCHAQIVTELNRYNADVRCISLVSVFSRLKEESNWTLADAEPYIESLIAFYQDMEQFRRVPLYECYMADEITEEQYHAEVLDYEEAHRKLNEQLTAIMENEGGRIVVQFKYEQSIQDAVRALHTD